MPARNTTYRVATVTITALLLALIVVAAISLHRNRALSLPISRATGIATLILPVVTGLSLQGGSSLAHHSSRVSSARKRSVSWSGVTLFVLLTIYETVIVTLSFTHMVSPSDLTCHLDQRWRQLYSTKDAESIKRIQDTHNCCGLHSVQDMAWPFPAKNVPVTACSTTFGRDRSCFGSWRQDEQISGGLFLLVASGTFLVKMFLLLFVRPETPWTQHRQFPAFSEETEDSVPQRDSQGRIEAQYNDEGSDAEVGTSSATRNKAITMGNGRAADDDRAPTLQPSNLHREQQEHNEWT